MDQVFFYTLIPFSKNSIIRFTYKTFAYSSFLLYYICVIKFNNSYGYSLILCLNLAQNNSNSLYEFLIRKSYNPDYTIENLLHSETTTKYTVLLHF